MSKKISPLWLIVFFIGGIIFHWGFDVFTARLVNTKESQAKAILNVLSERIRIFKNECGYFPNSLGALVEPGLEGCKYKKIIDAVPVDPWGKEIVYLKSPKGIYLLQSQEEGLSVRVDIE